MKSTRTQGYDVLLARLKAARKAAGLTQQMLAKKLRRPQSFVSKYEKAHQRLDVVEFVEVSRALGIDPRAALTALLDQAAVRGKREALK